MRLFFALWPDAVVRRELAQWAERCRRNGRGRLIPTENLHATLAFVGEVAASEQAALLALPDTLHKAAFDLVLDGIGYWRHNRIVHAGASATPDRLLGLARDLANALRGAGFRIEDRAYVPHVTLLRDARDPGEIAVAPLVWRVAEMVLVESRRENGRQVYRPLERWTLAA